MTFTEFLRDTQRTGPRPSFLHLARHDAHWPATSNRLEEFESFLVIRLEEESQEVIPELRDLWREYAHQVGRTAGKHDLDLALAAWGDYARHLQTCAGGGLQRCETAEVLFEKALEESNFEDLANPVRIALACEGIEEEPAEEDRDDRDDDPDVGEWEQPADIE